MEFIESKEQGFKTEVSQGGTNVSGGQKQRLSIARAIVKNQIYIFLMIVFQPLTLKQMRALERL